MYVDQHIMNMVVFVVGAVMVLTCGAAWCSAHRMRWLSKMISSFFLTSLFLMSSPHPASAQTDPWAQPVESGDQQASSPTTFVPSTIPEAPSPQNHIEQYVVVPGDNLWTIAQNHVRNGESMIDMWKRIMKENTETLRSKNPNLIYPGEIITISHDA